MGKKPIHIANTPGQVRLPAVVSTTLTWSYYSPGYLVGFDLFQITSDIFTGFLKKLLYARHRQLRDGGVDIHVFAPTLLHGKIMSVDHTLAVEEIRGIYITRYIKGKW